MLDIPLKKQFNISFVSTMPATSNDQMWYVIASVAVLLLLLSTLLLYGTYRNLRNERLAAERYRIDPCQVQLVGRLGDGVQGQVWKVNFRPSVDSTHPITAAAKTVLTQDSMESKMAFGREMLLLEFLHHANVVKVYGLCSNFHSPLLGSGNFKLLVMEYMNGGSCLQYIREHRTALKSEDLLSIGIWVTEACHHLTSLGVVHRDIAARNVLLRARDDGRLETGKLADYGLAKWVNRPNSLYHCVTSRLCPLRHTAPEGLRGEFTSKSDVWSTGVLLWEIFSLIDTDHVVPLAELNNDDFQLLVGRYGLLDDGHSSEIRRIATLHKPDSMPEAAWAFVRQCLHFHPEHRLDFGQLRNGLMRVRKNLRDDPLRRPGDLLTSGRSRVLSQSNVSLLRSSSSSSSSLTPTSSLQSSDQSSDSDAFSSDNAVNLNTSGNNIGYSKIDLNQTICISNQNYANVVAPEISVL